MRNQFLHDERKTMLSIIIYKKNSFIDCNGKIKPDKKVYYLDALSK